MFAFIEASAGGQRAVARAFAALSLCLLPASGIAWAQAPTASSVQVPHAARPAKAADKPARLVAADAVAGTAVFSIDDQLTAVKRGDALAPAGLRLVHVGRDSVLVEPVDAPGTRLHVAVGNTVPGDRPGSAPADAAAPTAVLFGPDGRPVAPASTPSVQAKPGANADVPTP